MVFLFSGISNGTRRLRFAVNAKPQSIALYFALVRFAKLDLALAHDNFLTGTIVYQVHQK